MNNMLLLIGSTIVAIAMATTMIFLRLKVAQKPTSVKRIILPPFFMSTGMLMFLFPQFHLSLLQVFEALLIGIIFSLFLIKSSKFELQEKEIYLIPSKSFIFILFGLLFVRIIIKLIIGSTISFGETSGMFFLLGFGMIVTWRISMLIQYNRLRRQTKNPHFL